MASNIVLILGAGPNIGLSVASKFSTLGFKVALVSRRGTGALNSAGHLSLTADFTQPSTIPAVFSAVQAHFHSAPNVVVYNAATLTPPPDAASVLSIPADKFAADLNVNTVSPYVTAQETLKGWATLGADVKKSFIFTGNALNSAVIPNPVFTTLGVGKSASAYWIGTADALYREKGYRFYYTDERFEDGKVKGTAIDGPAHAEFYAQLASHEGDLPWEATFVKDKGYVSFK
ncbi:NAD(P)-binding protein [Aaosphaeria arxii CBS 175.79]|uniref:NAD(P)-binding protein n=1 Tax=Aaosphaeria arxii CBS 175.79 TaxID=1450172 RepID=A0A6A5XQD4_9PLEO|nr:NAD(P)-binding protein [Aaosphaeria arxii CBS 175.79]KAF2014971.1 NAD(P)-binding protein [Aaosphaeria arxii CBS 175.79]